MDEAEIVDGCVLAEEVRWPIRSLGEALGLAGDGSSNTALVLVNPGGHPTALATGRCLHVGALPAEPVPLPTAALRSRMRVACFPGGALAESLGLAPFGLCIEPAALLGTTAHDH
jgi:hypothetical protein